MRNTYQSQLHTLMLLQKKAIRDIAKDSYLDHTYQVFVQYKCLKCLDIVKLKTLIIIYRAKNNDVVSIKRCELVYSHASADIYGQSYMETTCSDIFLSW